jgi:hypothetical protein
MTDIRQVQKILGTAMRNAARHVDQNIEGASLLMIMMGEAIAAIATEMAAAGDELRQPGGTDKVVRATILPIEQMLRENIAVYLASEAAEPRQ